MSTTTITNSHPHQLQPAVATRRSRAASFRACGAVARVIVLAVALLVCGSRAHAGGIYVARFGGANGNVVTSHVTALYYNPAGLALDHGTRVYIEAVLAHRSATYDRPIAAIDNPLPDGSTGTGTPASALDANSGMGNLSNALFTGFAGVATDAGIENFGAGLGVYVPFGGTAIWDKNQRYANNPLYPGALDGPQRWWVMEGTIQTMYVTAAAAYYFPRYHLSVGAGVNLALSKIDTIRARTVLGTDDLVSGDQVFEGRSLLAVSGTHVAASAGVMWQPTDGLWLGASYQSQPNFGEQTLTGELTNKFGAAATTTASVEVKQAMPDVLQLGGRYRARSDLELRLYGNMVRWSTFTRQCFLERDVANRNCTLLPDGTAAPEAAGIVANLPRNWHDSFSVSAGASYWPKPELELNGSITYDTNAIPDETMDPVFIDMNKMVGALGGRYRLANDRYTLSLTLMQAVYADRSVAPRARDANGVPITTQGPSRTPDGAGAYTQAATLVMLGWQAQW